MTTEVVNTPHEDTPTEVLPKCPCGHDRNHYRVSRDGKYTMWGWMLLMGGISVAALQVNFRCRQCDQVFDTTTDPKICAKRH